MAHSSLEKVDQHVPIRAEWRAFELRPQEAQPVDAAMEEEKQRQIESSWPGVQQLAKEQYGLEMDRGPWGVDTRLAHIGAKVAREVGEQETYRGAVFKAYWGDQKDIGRIEVLKEIVGDLGMDPDAFESRLKDEELLAEVLGEETGAMQTGIQGVPAIIVDQKYLLSGAYPAEALINALQKYQKTGALQ